MRILYTVTSLSNPVQHEQFHVTESPSPPEDEHREDSVPVESPNQPEDEDREDSAPGETHAVTVSTYVRENLIYADVHFRFKPPVKYWRIPGFSFGFARW